MQKLRIFVSSPGDVKAAREIAALTIERLAQDYARFFRIEPYLWEFEAMVASGHFQDSIEAPSAFDVVVLILWSRLGTHLPERTAVREYRGLDGRTPVTGTEWEFEEAFIAAKQHGAPDLLVYRSRKPAPFDTQDPQRLDEQLRQLKSLNGFWERHFANQGTFIGAYTSFNNDSEFAAALENHLRKLVEKRIAALGNGHDAAPKAWVQAPFRGLEAYEFEHAPIFFGQDEALARAMLQLTANAEAGSPFLLVLGASGSGKSSLVKAGILPKLFVPRRIAGTAFLRRVFFRPSDAQKGEDLFDALARRLTTQVGDQEGLSELLGHGQSTESLAAHLRHATAAPGYPVETALGQVTVQALQSGRMLEYETAKLVLVVDQLEELFINEGIPTGDRMRFIDLLVGLVRSGVVWVLATMRRDFWHRADETPELVRRSNGDCRLELLPPSPAQLSLMIRRPAAAAGIHFEAHDTSGVPLNEVIADEIAREPGALPLLSYLLDQLYRIDIVDAHGSALTYATYESLGKLEGAIATQAGVVLQRCAPEDRAALGSVLFSLVDMSTAEGSIERAVARRVPLATFQSGTPQRRLVDAFLASDARLLVSDADKGGSPAVRVAHEALISRWSVARDYVRSNADALKIRHRMEERHALWRDLDRGPGISTGKLAGIVSWRARFGREQGLLSDIDLTDGRRLLLEHRADTEPHLVAYIERSATEDQRIRSRSIRALTAVAILVTMLAIVASVAGSLATRKQHEAEYQRTQALEAQSRLLTEAATERLKETDVPAAENIILEVLTNPDLARNNSAAKSVFQEVRASEPELGALVGHGDYVWSAVYSPDGKHILTASKDKTARIWDARTGLPLIQLTGHSDWIRSAAYSPDGTRIVTASLDKTARVWDARSGAELLVLSGHTATVMTAAYSPDGRYIVTASSDKTAQVWDAVSGQARLRLKGMAAKVTFAAYSPDGTHIITASDDSSVRIWDPVSGAQVAILAGHERAVYTAWYSNDGRRVVTASADNTIRIWDAFTHNQLAVYSLEPGLVSARYSPDGAYIVTASADKTARILNAGTGAQIAILRGHGNVVESAAFSPDGTRIVTASVDNTARTWNWSDASLAILSGHGDTVGAAVFSPDGTRILTASFDKTARIWNAVTSATLIVLSGHGDGLVKAAYSPDGTRVVTASTDKTARIWDSSTGAARTLLSGHHGGVLGAAYSPDGARIVTASLDKTARVWDAVTGATLLVLSGHQDLVVSGAFSVDGAFIVTASMDKSARIWNSHTGTLITILTGHGRDVESASYSPDGRRIVTASDDGTARIWDANTGVPLITLAGHRDVVEWAAYSPDGTRIVTASDDKTARIWDAISGNPLAVLLGHTGAVSTAGYSPDGTRIVTASGDKTARIWDAHVPADFGAQLMWNESAVFDTLRNEERVRLGLLPDQPATMPSANASKCDREAAASYDPDRLASGVSQENIKPDIAISECSQEIKNAGPSPRLAYQMGRAQQAKHDLTGARRQFELAASKGYGAANIDLARLFLNSSGGMLNPQRAAALYEEAWREGIPIAAYELGRLYEGGTPAAPAAARLQSNLASAWVWYQKGADAGEANALARFAEREEINSVTESDTTKSDARLLHAFTYYAAAAERAHDEDWPDDAWRSWRYRRATLARLLAREGMMQQVADAYRGVHKQWSPRPPTFWQTIKAKLHR
jgi:WD40 repeat protein